MCLYIDTQITCVSGYKYKNKSIHLLEEYVNDSYLQMVKFRMIFLFILYISLYLDFQLQLCIIFTIRKNSNFFLRKENRILVFFTSLNFNIYFAFIVYYLE